MLMTRGIPPAYSVIRSMAESVKMPRSRAPALRQLELGPELGLAHQQDLQELGGRRLEVGEQAHLLHRLGRQILRLIDDEHGVLAGALALDEEVVEGHDAPGPRLLALADA